jgi:hypothetical protein
MANTLGDYNLIFFAQEALIHLWKALGMAPRIHMGYSDERRAFGRGETIQIRKPSTFTVADAPDEDGQDLSVETVTITLDQWKEVKFNLTDKELAFTQEEIIQEHVAPMAYSLANDIDQKCTALYKDIPWYDDLNATDGSVIADILSPRKTLFDNDVPIQDQQFMHYMINGTLEQGFLGLPAFTQHQGSGLTGEEAQLRGTLGRRFGVEIFANQNVATHTMGTNTDTAVQVDGTHLKGVSSILFDEETGSGTLVPGDTFVIAGNTQRYAITNTVTGSGSHFTGVEFTPPLAQDHSDADAVTINMDTHAANLMFHRNAFAIVIAPLPEIGNELGARIVTVTDPVTKLSLRSRIFYEGKTSKVSVAMDVLYGVKTLDPNLATRARGT